ncbi:MAG: biopolymer transporter ExbD [Bacteroidetes bacterium]|nr:biopolymer transporter ExbD [Bacteroidota bacterium]
MSEMPTSASGSNKSAVPTTRTSPPRVDLTPMVDLGFLLLSFFIFTTTLAQPLVKTLVVPAKNTPNTMNGDVAASRALTLLPTGDNRVDYYEGIFTKGFTQVSSVDIIQLRALLMQKQQQLMAKGGIIAIIQPDSSCSYGLLVNLLDELTIAGCHKYVLNDTDY